ncbi:MAG: M23 family metallopeptidase [bacterium]
MRILATLLLTTAVWALNWPIPPVDQVHPLGNNWGEYQDYGGGPYFHNGIDIITPDTTNVEVRAVAAGWVKAWGTIQAGLHYRIAVCDSPLTFTGRAEGWLYAHIDTARWHKNLGDRVEEGEVIGYLVAWPMDSSFDHCHFARISDTGATWQRFPNPTWWFIQNPLTLIQPNTDLEAPVFENARSIWRFAFCRDNQNNRYLHPDSLTGDVDIIARVYDRTGFSTGNSIWDRLAPYQLEYMIRRADGLVIVPWTLSVQFSNILNPTLVNVVYKDDNTCNSYGDYSRREYYFILTNTDGDSIIENTDINGKWATGLIADGQYWVIVRAVDVFGNYTIDSMLVQTRNGVDVDQLPAPVIAQVFDISPTIARKERTVRFNLVSPCDLTLHLIEPTGRTVATICNKRLKPGSYSIPIRAPSAGVYILELNAGRYRYQRKLVFTD